MNASFKDKLKGRFARWIMNCWPCIRGSGGKVTFVAPDFRRLTVKLPLNWRTRNAVGTIYGGSMYSSTDPFFMIMLMQILGPTYIVWDKGCAIRFRRPAKQTLFVEFEITADMLADILKHVGALGEHTFTWSIAYRDREGQIYAEFDKTLYVSTKEHYREKIARRLNSPHKKSVDPVAVVN